MGQIAYILHTPHRQKQYETHAHSHLSLILLIHDARLVACVDLECSAKSPIDLSSTSPAYGKYTVSVRVTPDPATYQLQQYEAAVLCKIDIIMKEKAESDLLLGTM